MRFIYIFDPALAEQLTALGYALLSDSEQEWIFDNPAGTEPPIDRYSYALSDTLTFSEVNN
jgi:hypothetical protein